MTEAARKKFGDVECELCGRPATHFCECEACREASGEDEHGQRPNGELGEGRWLCNDCRLGAEFETFIPGQ